MKLFKLLLLGLAITLASCGGDDPLSERIVGTWELSSVTITGCSDASENLDLTLIDSNNCITAFGDTSCNVSLRFATDGTLVETYTEDSNVETDNYIYTVNDENESGEICEDVDDCDSSFTVDGDTLTRIIIDGSCTITVVYDK